MGFLFLKTHFIGLINFNLRQTMKKKLSIGAIVVFSILNIFASYRVSGRGVVSDIAGLIGSFAPIVIIAWLISKFANKKADKDTKLMTFAFIFCIWVALITIYNLYA